MAVVARDNRLQEDREPVSGGKTTWLGKLSCFDR